jgi:hypothetical protein
VIAFKDLPAFVLGPLRDRPDTDWYQAPPGKWSAAQVVDHLGAGIDKSGSTFATRVDKPPMARRPRTLFERAAHLLIMRVGWFPPGRKAPSQSLPADRPERAAVERQLTEGVLRFLDLERRLLPARRHDLFVKHPVLGDLTLEEWMHFHARHATHHARQIRERLAG